MLRLTIELFIWLFDRWFEEDEDAKNEERRRKGAPVPRGSGDED